MAAVPSSLFDLPLSAAYDSARWSKAALDVWTGSLASSAAIAAQREQRLVALVAHAFEFSPYYSRLYRKLPVSSSARLRLSDLPPVTKQSLMAEFDDVITEPTVTRRAVDEFVAQPDRCGGALLGRYSVWTSSGTTGEPGYFVHDPDAIAVYDALEWQRFRGVRSASDLARQLIAGDRYAMVAATGGHFAGISTVERMRRSMPWLTASLKGFSLLQPLERLVAELNEFRPTLLASYPTAAQMLADEQHAGRLNLRLREVWTGGETLPNPRPRAGAARVRLPGAQFVWRIGVSADRVGVSVSPPAPEQRLGHPGTDRPPRSARRCRYALALGAIDQSGESDSTADPL